MVLLCRGYNGPGGYHNERKYFNCTGGAAGYIDRIVLGVNHIYQYPTIKRIYQSQPFDPEGLLGYILKRIGYDLLYLTICILLQVA